MRKITFGITIAQSRSSATPNIGLACREKMPKCRKVFALCYIIVFFLCSSAFGQEDGVNREYYDSGGVHYERTFKNGQKDGQAREYYEDGTVKREVIYVKDKRQGVLTEYHPNGVLRTTIEYIDDFANGVVDRYDEKGRLRHSSIYENDKPNNKEVKQFDYFDGGQLKYEYYFNEDEGGYSKTYYENGQVSLDIIIDWLGLYECKNYDKEGNFISDECPEE